MTASTPRLSIPYPLGTDDISGYPAVAASAATVLDNAILTQTAVTDSTTATAGQMVQVNGGSGVTVTLPSPVANTTVGVRNGTGVASLTVVPSTGKIYGLGLGTGGVSSLSLPSLGATAIMIGDGSNFNIISLIPPATFTITTATYSGSSLMIATGSPGVIALNTPLVDPGSHFNATSHHYTAPSGGYYEVSALISAVSSASGQTLEAFVYQNGSAVANSLSNQASGSSQVVTALLVPFILACFTGDTLQLYAEGSSSGLLSNSAILPYLTVKQVG